MELWEIGLKNMAQPYAGDNKITSNRIEKVGRKQRDGKRYTM